MPASSHIIDRVGVTFDDDRTVADAGLLLSGTLMGRLGLESATDEMVDVGYRPGRKLATLVHALVAGGDCIDDVALLLAGSTGRVLGDLDTFVTITETSESSGSNDFVPAARPLGARDLQRLTCAATGPGPG